MKCGSFELFNLFEILRLIFKLYLKIDLVNSFKFMLIDIFENFIFMINIVR